MHVAMEFELEDEIDTDEKKKRPAPRVELLGDDNLFHLKFYNFDKSFGHSLQEPFMMGWSDKHEPVTLLASIYKYKSLSKIEFQIMMGEAE
ncbi:hypothetical protein D3C78_1826160 [compost metagenome]